MQMDQGLRRILVAIASAIAASCVVGGAVFYRMAERTGGLHGGPEVLSAAMAGLFAGGLAGLLVLVLVLRMLRER
jgi:hypothetical protein